MLSNPGFNGLSAEQKWVFVTMLMMAEYREHDVPAGRGLKRVKPGEFYASLKAIADEAGVGVQVVRTCLKKLSKKPTDYLTDEVTDYNVRKITVKIWKSMHDGGVVTDEVTDSPTDIPFINKNIKEAYIIIFNKWREQKNLKRCDGATEGLEKAIEKRLTNGYAAAAMARAIGNYAAVLANDGQYFSHSWTLEEFLGKENGLPVFMDEAAPHDNWKKLETGKGGEPKYGFPDLNK